MNWMTSFVVLVAVVVLIDATSFRSFRKQKRGETGEDGNSLVKVINKIREAGTDADLQTILDDVSEGELQNYISTVREDLNKMKALLDLGTDYTWDIEKLSAEDNELLKQLEEWYHELPNVDPKEKTLFLSDCHKDYNGFDFSQMNLHDAKQIARDGIKDCLKDAWEDMKEKFDENLENKQKIVDALENLHEYTKEILTLIRFEIAVIHIDDDQVSLLRGYYDSFGMQETTFMNFVMKYWPLVTMHSPSDDGSDEDDNVTNDESSNQSTEDSKKRKWAKAAKKAFSVRSPLARAPGGSKLGTERMLANILYKLRNKHR